MCNLILIYINLLVNIIDYWIGWKRKNITVWILFKVVCYYTYSDSLNYTEFFFIRKICSNVKCNAREQAVVGTQSGM